MPLMPPSSSVTAAELAHMRTHPAAGARLLGAIEELQPALPYVLFHHERWDGGGYPHGLGGTEIPLGARIFAVADAFDAMTSDRPYRAARSRSVAREEIVRCAGGQFDPQIVEAFLRVDEREWARSSEQPAQSEAPAPQAEPEARPRQATIPVPFPAV